MFVREKVADLPLIEGHVRKLISLMGSGDGAPIMLNKLFFRFSLDASTHFLFGHSVNSLDVEQSEFATAFDEVQRVQALQGRLGYDDPSWFCFSSTDNLSILGHCGISIP